MDCAPNINQVCPQTVDSTNDVNETQVQGGTDNETAQQIVDSTSEPMQDTVEESISVSQQSASNEIDASMNEAASTNDDSNTAEASTSQDKKDEVASNFEENKVFVGGLSRDVDEEILCHYFSAFGSVRRENVLIMRDGYSNVSRGFGFVRFDNAEELDRLMEGKQSVRKMMDENSIEIKRARKRSELPPNSIKGEYLKKLFVRGLPTAESGSETSSDQVATFEQQNRDELKQKLQDYFSQFGTIKDVNVNVPRGFAFITFDSEEAVSKALKESLHRIDQFECTVASAKPPARNYYNYNRMYSNQSYYDPPMNREPYHYGYGPSPYSNRARYNGPYGQSYPPPDPYYDQRYSSPYY